MKGPQDASSTAWLHQSNKETSVGKRGGREDPLETSYFGPVEKRLPYEASLSEGRRRNSVGLDNTHIRSPTLIQSESLSSYNPKLDDYHDRNKLTNYEDNNLYKGRIDKSNRFRDITNASEKKRVKF